MPDASDVVFTFGFNSWAGAASRGFSFPEERLATLLPNHPRVRRVLVCDPFRSASRKLARTILGRTGMPFPTDASAHHHAPVRVWRSDPTTENGVERVYAAYERGVRQRALSLGFERPAVVTGNPLLAGFGDLRWAGAVTYYAWDDWTASEPRRRWWPVYEEAFRRLRAKRRRVVAVSATLADRIMAGGVRAVVPNGIDPDEWRRLPPAPDWFASRPSPRLLYVGTLESRIDVEQIGELAAAFPDGSITLVGSLRDPAHFARLKHIAGIAIHPWVSRRDVCGLVAHADVGLVPHVRSPLTEAMSPLKLYEYLAGGLPVAAVDLPGIAGISDRVVLVPPGTSMVPAVKRALALGRQSEAERLAFIARNSWKRRFDSLLDVALAQQDDGF